MRRRPLPILIAVIVAAVACGSAAAQRYNYGGSSGGYTGEEGFTVFLELGTANPRNTDNIVAAAGPNVVIPSWDDELAGRLGGGYRFAEGSQVSLSFWTFSAEQDAADVGPFEFPIGPVSGFEFDVETEIEARTVDAAWSHPHQATDALEVEWSVGLRYASFEETTGGEYMTASGPLGVSKSLEGDMIGPRAGGRVTYRFGSLSGSAGVAVALLDGDLKTSAGLEPQPAGTAPLLLEDDSRSGAILDVDVRGAWHNANDTFSVWIGWEQQVWEDIAADLARNLPDSEVISRERDSVTFSWVKVGASYKF